MKSFRVGDRCRVVKNLLAPESVGYEVTIIQVPTNRSNVYRVRFTDSGMTGMACGTCLELIDHEDN